MAQMGVLGVPPFDTLGADRELPEVQVPPGAPVKFCTERDLRLGGGLLENFKSTYEDTPGSRRRMRCRESSRRFPSDAIGDIFVLGGKARPMVSVFPCQSLEC